jgi:adenosylcobinamide kinase / adenosylcobinamide-phosphate guanylyltransferase
MIVLVTGGARSGKSAIAEARCLALGAAQLPRATYIATAEPFDDEMRARIAQHRARRGPEWHDHPAPMDLAQALHATDTGPARLVDCLTMWLNNLIYHQRDVAQARGDLRAALGQMRAPVVLVSNEIGMGIVPDNALARSFRDAQGLLNQEIAAVADEVILAVSGLPLRVK